ncbi:MAG: Putative diheme cytochrome c-553 [Burkholderiaceae bacterium]|jgi:mono/diheme cytochrome c family protein|nr:MAG: Putative diheme cytochrome c-553 [Burkholderiaceae bacterium]
MRRWIKRIAWLLIAIALLVIGTAATGLLMAQRKLDRRVDVQVAPIVLPTDAASLEHGRYLFLSRGCAECHGANGGGREFINDGKGMRAAGPNITPGGVTAKYAVVDWVRTVRQGVKPDGRPVFIMPSEDFNRLTDADLGALVAYLKSLPPLPARAAVFEIPVPVRALYGFGVITDAAAKIDHGLPPAQPVPKAVTPAYGAYVANMCMGCHGAGLSGGRIPGGPPDWPPAANLTPGAGSVMGRYASAEAFVAMLRSGKRPDGTSIPVMPFGSLAVLDDTDARAVYAYLQTVPARPAGQR